MFTFDKLIIISKNRYSVRTDKVDDITKLFDKLMDVNTRIILFLKYPPDTYMIDVGKVILNNGSFREVDDIYGFINKLTPEIIYSYQTDAFKDQKLIRSFMSHDLPEDVVVSPFCVTTGEMAQSSYDPNYRDMVISCAKYDLSKVIPVIDGKLRMCGWSNRQVWIKDRVDLVKHTTSVTFISFGETEVVLSKLSDVIVNNSFISNEHVAILVLCGSMFYDTKYIFDVDRQRCKLSLNEQFIWGEFKKRGYTSYTDVINDPDSFVILVKADQVLVRDIVMIPAQQVAYMRQFVYYEETVHDHHTDYICIDNADDTVCGISVVDERYVNVHFTDQPKEHHIYAESGSGDMRLIQLAVC